MLSDEYIFKVSVKHHCKASQKINNQLHERLKEGITLAIVPKPLAEVANNNGLEQSQSDSLLCKFYYRNLILHVDH